jgi:hypothetical protein
MEITVGVQKKGAGDNEAYKNINKAIANFKFYAVVDKKLLRRTDKSPIPSRLLCSQKR